MENKEWDEEVDNEEKISFGDRVRTSDGYEGMVTELDGEEYRVVNNTEVGWFIRKELTLIK